MKHLVVTDINGCEQCLSCEMACAKAFYKVDDITLSCIHIVVENNENAIKTCNQCGKCAEVCPADAITKNAKGVYVIDKKACVGCGTCAEACPQGVIVQSATADYSSKCIACGICAKACPQGILEVVDD